MADDWQAITMADDWRAMRGKPCRRCVQGYLSLLLVMAACLGWLVAMGAPFWAMLLPLVGITVGVVGVLHSLLGLEHRADRRQGTVTSPEATFTDRDRGRPLFASGCEPMVIDEVLSPTEATLRAPRRRDPVIVWLRDLAWRLRRSGG